MNNVWRSIVLGAALMGCAHQRTALREPDNRWALATWPQSPAPIDLHAQPIPGFNETNAAPWGTSLTAIVFVAMPESRARHPRLRLAKIGQMSLTEVRVLDLYCPQPLWIHTAEEAPKPKGKRIGLITAEALIFR